MLIHSVMMLDALLPQQEMTQTSLLRMGNCWIQGNEQSGNRYIERIISTNPADYPDPRLNPGQPFPNNDANNPPLFFNGTDNTKK